jgi:hypothetical protein
MPKFGTCSTHPGCLCHDWWSVLLTSCIQPYGVTNVMMQQAHTHPATLPPPQVHAPHAWVVHNVLRAPSLGFPSGGSAEGGAAEGHDETVGGGGAASMLIGKRGWASDQPSAGMWRTRYPWTWLGRWWWWTPGEVPKRAVESRRGGVYVGFSGSSVMNVVVTM